MKIDSNKNTRNYSTDTLSEISFSDIFNLSEIQQLQDLFSDATGVASQISHPDGTPITRPSNFSRLCGDIIRKTEKGCASCYKSDSIIGSQSISAPSIQPCHSCGLWEAGASISVGGQHIANWVIGQVRNQELDEKQILQYADEIGVDRDEFLSALREVPVMSALQFNKVSKMMFAFANELSEKAYNNLLLKTQIAEREKAAKMLMESEQHLFTTLHSIGDAVLSTDKNGMIVNINARASALCGWSRDDAAGRALHEVFNIVNSDTREIIADPVKKVLASGQISGLANHTVLISRKGIEYQISNSAAPIKDEEGKINGVVLVFSDVTEKYKTEKALLESERSKSVLLSNIPGVAYRCRFDTDWTMEFVSEGFYNLTGYKAEDILQKQTITFNEMILPEYREHLWEVWAHAVKFSESIHEEYRIRTADNQEKWVWEQGIPVYNEAGEVEALEGLILDITARKLMENTLHNERLLLRTIIDNIPDAIYTKDINCRKTLANTTEVRYMGFQSEADVLGKEDIDFYPRELAEKYLADDKLVMQTGVPVINREDYIVDRNNQKRWLLSSKLPLYDKDKRIIGLVGIGHDITEHRKSENAMRESESLYRNLVEKLPDGVYKSTHDGKFVEVNPAMAKMLGYASKEELMSIDIKTQLYFEETIRENTDFYDKQIKTGVYRMKKKDGSEIWVEDHGWYNFDESVNILFHEGILRDITESRQAALSLQESEALYRNLVEKLPDGVYKSTHGGKLVDGNPALIKMLGYDSKEELMSIDIKTQLYFEPTDRESQVLEDNLEEMGIYRLRKKDGSEIWVEDKGWYIQDEKGEIIFHEGVMRDITQRKLAELALQESEALYRNLVERLPDGVYKSTHAGKFVDINPAMIKMLGYGSKEELMAIDIKTQLYFKPSDRVSQALQDNNEELGIYRMKKKDGSPIWVEDKGWYIQDEKGEIVFHEGVMRDITQRKLAELALQESEALYRNLVERLPDGVYKSTHDGKFVDVNPAMIRMLGYDSKEELLKIDIKAQLYFKPSDRESLVLQEKHEEMGVYPLKKKDGSAIWVEDHGWYNVDEKGNILFHEGVMRDVTERNRADEALRKSEEQHRTILQTAQDGFWLVDKVGRLLEVNDAYCKMSGYTAEELLTMHISDVESAETSENTYLHMLQIMKQGESRFESRHRRKDGSIFDIEASVKYQAVEDGRFVAFIHNITDRKIKEQEFIKAKEKAEESDRLKSAFLANMSHEIRTPMNGILGFAELLKSPGLSGEEQQEYIRIIKKSGDRMLNIINDIIDISKIESGQASLFESETKVNEQTQFLYSFFKPEVDKKGIGFVLRNGLPDNEAVIKTDKEKLYAILTNLIKNAIKFTREGSIEIGYKLIQNEQPLYRTDVIQSAPSAVHLALEFYVKDTGYGIPVDRQQAIFDRFVQADIADSRAFQGAGLGLSISKAYVEMMGGRIRVESEEGKGSVFYFTIPYYTGSVQNLLIPQLMVNEENSQRKKLKILIVEDDETSEMLISIAVRMLSKEVIKVRSGSEAIEACRNNPDIDLILMDIKMPEMDGYEATRQIRLLNKDVFIIAQTAYGLESEKEKALDSGCSEYISKPLDIALLKDIIQKHFKTAENGI